jgi:hypothetical protein
MEIAISDSVKISFTDIEDKFIKTLLYQSGKKDMINTPLDVLILNHFDIIDNLITSRSIYNSMFGYQYAEEKEIVPKLKNLIKYIKAERKRT